MARILGTSIGKSSSILFLTLVIFISLALSKSSLIPTREGLDETANPIVSAIISDTSSSTPSSSTPPAATVTPTSSSPTPTSTPTPVPLPTPPPAANVSPSTYPTNNSSMTSPNNLADSIDQIVQKAVKDALSKCNLCK